MRPQRLSYQAAGAALAPRAAPRTRAAAPAFVRPDAAPAPRFGDTPARQRRVVVATLLAVHALGVVGLLDASRRREVAVDAKPLFLAVVDTPAPVASPKALPPPPAPAEAPPAAATSLPKTIPASAVQYLVPPAPVYSRISARMRESGKALVRVFIDEGGLPRSVQLAASTGFARLDDAALAAVRNCRFRPYLENGVAVAGWAAIPIEFELPA